ncbi:MAG: 3-octaprenyl-4-hydroxybenzoate carboxy-lyase [Hyphomicrobiales bacterium]|nr:MAG: 3-octaprenyl-4-hydroxybenzoate carboxy-lyase [Hyphomicrobiales bacterium]
MRRVIVGISGASGAAYGKKVLEILNECDGVETHLILSNAAWTTIAHELGDVTHDLEQLADVFHDNSNVGAGPASGSFNAFGMIVAPCSVRTMSAIAYGQADNLLVRAADVSLKERRPLVLMVRETPLHLGHLRTMTQLTEMGAVIAPPVPAMYAHPKSLGDVITQSAARALHVLGLEIPGMKRWPGLTQT